MTTAATLLRLSFILCASTALSAGCTQKSSVTNERVCSGSAALSAGKYKGIGLAPKTIALTFDDGPGARTAELSLFLKAEGAPSAFFVNGKMLTNGGGAILQQLVADGHVIGNHTQSHLDLTTLDAAKIVTEVDQTDALIAPFVPNERFMFRPPFGAYSDATFGALEASTMKKYVGPIDWDMGNMMGPQRAADWDCWSPQGTSSPPVLDVKTCGDLYLAEIRATSSGIVLLHDPYFIDNDPAKGGTVDMVKYIVPILKAEGFTFVRVDMVPSIADVLPPLVAPPSVDAGGADAGSASGSGNAAAASSSSGNATPGQPAASASGDSSEPCPPSPQPQRANLIESGHLRHP